MDYIDDIATLETLYGAVSDPAKRKVAHQLTPTYRRWIMASRLCMVSTVGAGGTDGSPRGDDGPVVLELDPQTLAMPDWRGNNRLDTLSNIVANPAVGLLFMVPGYDETVRINGTAAISRDPDLLALLQVKGRTPSVAIVVSVHEVFLHCAKAFRRARLWEPDQHQDRSEMPSLPKIVLDQTTGAPDDPAEMQALDDALEAEYQKTMY